MQTQFSGNLTEEDLKDVARMVRPGMYWPKLLLKNWYGILLFCALTWATVAGLIGTIHPNWRGVGTIWLVIVAGVAWSFYSTRKSEAKRFAQMNARLPITLILENGGVKLEFPVGATAFHPWPSFAGWREGKRVIVLQKENKTSLMLPVSALPEIERQSLRQFLRGSIPPQSR